MYRLCQELFWETTMWPENVIYNDWCDTIGEQIVMPKSEMLLKKGKETFGERLARLRHAAGYSQRELAAEIGTSNRMLVHYEKHAGEPTAHVLPLLANALGVTTDQLLGMEKVKSNGRIKDTKLWRRFTLVEKLPRDQRKPIIQIIDAVLKKETA